MGCPLELSLIGANSRFIRVLPACHDWSCAAPLEKIAALYLIGPGNARRNACCGRLATDGSEAQGPVVVNDQRRMLGEARLTWQACAAYRTAHAGREDLVVETPAEVQRLRLLAVRPPAVLLAFAADFTQGID